ncbi:uncharacterized protein [Chelonus insularis]|uniref:uncharacterized protein n=1 Tax=Chelonus insularis TaxID=460826 RepID=UPI00158EE713|nr:uncharacterized protein LOC118066595 [Chelonus insularis]
MFKLTALFLCIYGVAALPTVLYSKPTVQINDEEQLSLPGVENLAEKSIPSSKLELSTDTHLPGTSNYAERIQVPLQRLPGTGNLAEKVIPPDGLKKLSQPFVEYA